MKLKEAQNKFIQSWGSLGSKWGINKTMAQIHGLFLISAQALCTEDIMEILKISRGNANMNIRTLIDWGLVYKESKIGERKEYFIGEKDMWLILKRVMKIRKEKELDPMLRVLGELKNIEDKTPEAKEFTDRLYSIEKFAVEADSTLEKLIKVDEHWFWSTFVRLMR